MNEEDYSNFIWKSFPIDDLKLNALGLCAEAGEFGNKVKQGYYKVVSKVEMLEELADVYWHLDQCARLLGYSLSDVREVSVTKTRLKNPEGGIADERIS